MPTSGKTKPENWPSSFVKLHAPPAEDARLFALFKTAT